jgi:hypothetical protein
VTVEGKARARDKARLRKKDRKIEKEEPNGTAINARLCILDVHSLTPFAPLPTNPPPELRSALSSVNVAPLFYLHGS